VTAEPLRIGVAGLGRALTPMLSTFVADARVALVAAADPRPDIALRHHVRTPASERSTR
jgi:hypothetical protein